MKEIMDLLKEIDGLNGELCYCSYLEMKYFNDDICLLVIDSDDDVMFEYVSKSMEDVLKNTKEGLREILKHKKCKKQLVSLIEEYGNDYLSAVMDEIDGGK